MVSGHGRRDTQNKKNRKGIINLEEMADEMGKRMEELAEEMGKKWDELSHASKELLVHHHLVGITPKKQTDKYGFFPEDITSLELILPDDCGCDDLHPVVLDELPPPSLLRLSWRAVHLLWNFAPVLSTVWLALLSSKFREKFWFNWVAACLAKSGPAFIKWGQWASTRSDMFPDSLCVPLSNLHADAPAHSWSFTQRTVESSLCIPPGRLFDVFQSFEKRPVASGSIAQVHRAILRPDDGIEDADGGTLVAVKVRHPNVSRLIDMDFRLMSFLADIVDRIPSLSYLQVRSSVEQFSHTMAAQAHLNVEAHHLEVLNHNFRHFDDVGFPRPLVASAAVIIETFERGRIVTDIIDKYDEMAAVARRKTEGGIKSGRMTVEEAEEDGEDERGMQVVESSGSGGGAGYEIIPMELAKFIVTNGLTIYLKMLLVDNLMHADLHPGNIMLDVQNEANEEGEVESAARSLTPVGGHSGPSNKAVSGSLSRGMVTSKRKKQSHGKFRGHFTLVDAGMVAQLDEEESVNFIGLFSSLGEGDGRAAAEAVLRFSSPDDGDVDEDCGCDGRPFNTQLSEEQREAFINDMDLLFQEKCRGYGSNVDVGEVLRGVLSLVRKHRVRIDANYATLVVNALCVEGMGKKVCPSYNVLDAAKPLLRSYGTLCHSKKGRNKCQRSKFRQSVLRLSMPILYLKKKLADDRFFREQRRQLQLKRGGKGGKLIQGFRLSPMIKNMLGLVAVALVASDVIQIAGVSRMLDSFDFGLNKRGGRPPVNLNVSDVDDSGNEHIQQI